MLYLQLLYSSSDELFHLMVYGVKGQVGFLIEYHYNLHLCSIDFVIGVLYLDFFVSCDRKPINYVTAYDAIDEFSPQAQCSSTVSSVKMASYWSG